MIFIDGVLSGVCIVTGATGLLTKPLKARQNLLLIIYVAVMAIVNNFYLKMGQIFGIIMAIFLMVLIFNMVNEYKVLNIFFACLGYTISMTANNGMLFIFDSLFFIKVEVILSKNIYLIMFTLIYILMLKGCLYILRKILYCGIKVQQLFDGMSKKIQNGLVVNMAIYIVIFLVNISMGERVGYSTEALRFNSILFLVCMIVSCITIIECMKGIATEEKGKAQLHQQQILENYVGNLESMVDEMRAFKHDYKNILSTMTGYIREGQIEELKKFFYEKTQLPEGNSESRGEAWKYLKDIEPMGMKGFLYEKFLLVMARDIEIKVDISHNLNVRYDAMENLVRVLGIFIDNAIEASEVLENGMIGIVIAKTEKGVLFRIENNYKEEPNLSMITQNGYSTKGSGRGLGLYWAEKIISEHTDMFHETKLSEGRFIQILEVSI